MKRLISFLLTLSIVVGCIPSIGAPVFAAETSNDGTIQVEPAYAGPGDTVTVNVTVKNNPGVLGMTLKVTYDESKVTLVSVANGEAFSYMTFTTPKDLSSGCKLPWAAEVITEEDIKDGVIATLTFEVAEETDPNELVEIGLSYENGAIIDNDLEPLSPEIINGVINVIDYTPGDLNEDGFINTTDVVYLMRHIAGGYNVVINESAADVNDDGNRNTTDVVYIMRFIAGGYGIRLQPSTPKCDHSMQAIAAKAATCTEDGNYAYWHCAKCEKYFNNETGTSEIAFAATVISAKGHTEVVDAAKAPTCTETGLTEGKHCSVCSEIIVAQTEIAASGHTEAIDAAKAPTCTQIGLTAGKHCSVCGEVIVAQTEIAASGHTEVVDAAKAPSCAETGLTEGKHCSVCSIVLVPQTEVPASHSYVDGICSACGYIPPSEGLEFTLDSTGESYSVTGMGTCTDTNVVIPSAYSGKPVTSIGNWAFSECINMTSVIIPDSVISIGSAAFLDCTGLSVVNIGAGLNNIGLEAFTGCTGLTGIWVSVDNHTYSNDSRGVLFSKDMTTLIQAPGGISGAYTIPDSVKSIGYNAFICCRLLDSVTIPDSVTSVGDYAFQYCDSLSIHCEAVSEPEGWSSGWNPDNRPVIWDINHTQHVYVAVVTVPTCTEVGYTTYTCACGNTYTADEVAALGHTEVIDAAKTPTCTETGLTEGKHCSVCNEVLVEQTEIATIAHIPCLYDDVHIALTHKNATNYPFKNTDGKWYATNAYATISTYTLTAPADCTVTVEYGLSTSYSNDYFNVKHNSTRLVRLTGNKTETRTLELVAGDTLTFEYYKSGYSSTSAWFQIIDTVAKNVETTSVTAHCTQDVICKNCERVLYPKTGHSPVTDPGHAATCTETGLADGQICSVCDEVVVTKRVISPTGHSYTNNTCTVCDHVLTPSTGLAYSLKDDGTYMITGLGTCTDKTIVVPANINGKAVSYIAGDAFLRKGSFTGLYIPGTVKSIGSSAFEDTYFDFIYMEEGVTSVGSNAFSGSYGGNSLIVIPSTLTSIGSQAFMCGADCVVINSQEAASRLTAYDGAGYLLYHSQSALIRSDLSYGGYASQLGYPAVLVEFMGEQYNSFSHNRHSYERCEILDWSGMRCTSCHMLSDFAEVTLDVSAGDTDSVTAHIYSEAGKGIMKLSGYGNISNSIPSTYMYLVEEIIIEEGILSVPDYAFNYYSNLERVTVSSSIASIGSQAFYSCDSLVSIEVSAENQHYMSLNGDLYSKDGTTLIQYAIGKKSEVFNVPQDVVSIGTSAFYGCDNLTKVVIPNGVTTIGDSAFSYCTNLSNIELPSSLRSIGGDAFNGCGMLKQIVLPDGMTAIGAYAFRGCTGLESIDLPNSLTSIGSYAFYGCSALVDITIPDGVTMIDGFAFAECTSLTSIVIPNSVASMGKYVFSKTTLLVCCEAASKPSGWNTDWNKSDSGGNLWIVWNYGGEHGVDENSIKWVLLNTGDVAVCGYDGDKTELTIPTSINGKTVTTIMDKAFYNCKTLKNVIVGNTITSIGASAFESCTKLESITIPDDVTHIGYSAFKNCTMLKTANLGTNITDIWEYTFYGCTSLTSIVIPDSVTTIGYYAFKGCTSLTSVTIGKKVTSIEMCAFEGCAALTAIVLPGGLESIGYSAFKGCTALLTVVIPDSVTSMGSDAFFNCTNLSIFCEATKKPTSWDTSWNRKSQAGSSSYYVHSVTWGYKGN